MFLESTPCPVSPSLGSVFFLCLALEQFGPSLLKIRCAASEGQARTFPCQTHEKLVILNPHEIRKCLFQDKKHTLATDTGLQLMKSVCGCLLGTGLAVNYKMLLTASRFFLHRATWGDAHCNISVVSGHISQVDKSAKVGSPTCQATPRQGRNVLPSAAV